MDVHKNLIDVLKSFHEISIVRMVLIVLSAWLAIKLIKFVLPRMAERLPGRFRHYILPMVPLLRLVVFLAAIGLIIPAIIQPTVQNLVAILGAAGVAVGFALKDYVSNLAAGIVALYERPYRVGDWVEVDGAYGEVKSMDVRALRVYTPDDTMVTIPHGKLWTSNIYNSNDGNRNQLCVADFYLTPRHDAVFVKKTLLDVILTSPFLQFDNRMAVIVSEKPWGTHYKLKAYPIDSADQFEFISDLVIRGKTALIEMGVEPVNISPGLVPGFEPKVMDRACDEAIRSSPRRAKAEGN